MSNGMSSCYPDRLATFSKTTGGMYEGLAPRARHLGDAIDRYTRGCAGPYLADCSHAEAAVRCWADQVRELGAFAGAVSTGFAAADFAGGARPGDHRAWDSSDVVTAAVRRHFGESDAQGAHGLEHPPVAPLPDVDLDDLLAEEPGGAAHIAVLLDHTSLDVSITTVAHGSVQLATRSGEVPRFLTSGNPEAAEVTRFLKGAGTALTALAGFADEWAGDPHDSFGSRMLKSATTGAAGGAGTAMGSGLGEAIGTAVCAESGPAAVACSEVGGGLGGVAGGFVAEKLVRPALDDLLPPPARPPNEHDVDEITEELRQPKPQKSFRHRVEVAARRAANHDPQLDPAARHELDTGAQNHGH